MSYNLHDIKSEITTNVYDHFLKNNVPSTVDFDKNFDFQSGLDLFFKVVLMKSGVSELDGLVKTLIPSLHEAYISKKGDTIPLRTIAGDLEGYLKKIVYLTSNHQDNFSNDKSKTLIPLFNYLGLGPKVLNANDFVQSNLDGLKGQSHFMEFLCRSYITRNSIHKAPDWKLSELAISLESIVVVYLYSTFKHMHALMPYVASIELPKNPNENEKKPAFSSKQALYDLISYNSGTSQIRNQIVTSFILHTLSGNNGATSLAALQKTCNGHFNTDADISFYKSIVKELSKLNKVAVGGLFNDQISLSENEVRRIKKVKEDLYYQEGFFALEIAEVLKEYNLEHKLPDVIEKLTKLFEANFNVDLSEMLDKGAEAQDNVQSVKDFQNFIRIILPKTGSVENLSAELLQVCAGNDFLTRVTAGQVFAKVSNLPQIQEYLSQQDRVIYLDTNVLLYVMCCYYQDDDEYESIYYQTTRDLLKFADGHKNMVLKTTTLYIHEVAYHFKEALLLIPFEEFGLFQKTGSSNNVFFKFYINLKQLGHLDDDVDSFGDFMEGFGLYEDNIDDTHFFKNTSDLIVECLNMLNVTVVELPYYSKDDAFEIVKTSLMMSGKIKDPVPMDNDTLMLCHLADKNYHNNEPTFVTWDNCFYDIRKRYVSKFKNGKMWHLFTPNKLLNHFQLLEFKIDPTNVTNDFLTIIDGFSLHEKTRNVLDLVGKLLDIEKEERRRYVTKFKEFNSQYVFNVEESAGSEFHDLDFKPVEKIISELFRYFTDKKNGYSFSDLKALFSNKSNFDEVIQVFQRALENYSKERKVLSETFVAFGDLIKKNKGERN